MKSIPLGLLIVLCLALAGDARGQKRAVLLGATTTPTTGNAGSLMAMHLLCRADYGSKARMCTTRDLLVGLDTKGTLANSWIQLVPAGLDGAGNVLDVTGFSFPAGPQNCNGWHLNFSLNPTICNSFRAVACCK